jgi:hypothetical protein
MPRLNLITAEAFCAPLRIINCWPGANQYNTPQRLRVQVRNSHGLNSLLNIFTRGERSTGNIYFAPGSVYFLPADAVIKSKRFQKASIITFSHELRAADGCWVNFTCRFGWWRWSRATEFYSGILSGIRFLCSPCNQCYPFMFFYHSFCVFSCCRI